MKKVIALILFATMLVSLAACGSNSQLADAAKREEGTSASVSDVQPQASAETDEFPAEAEPTPEEPDVPEESDAPAESKLDEQPPAETDTPEETTPDEQPPEEPDETDPILGVYTENSYTYENEFIGIGCQLNEEWDVFDSDLIAELNGMVVDMMTDETLADQLEQGGYVQPFYAQAEEGLITVNITVENLGILYGALLGEQEYAELAVEQLPAAFEALGMTDSAIEIGTAVFAGDEHVAVYISGMIEDIPFYETLVCVKIDRYIATITAASYLTDVTGDILAMFYGM